MHPADLTFKLPDNVSLGVGALVEPFAVGFHAVNRANLKLGSEVLVIGAGTIGIVTGLAAMASGAGKVVVADISQKQLDVCAKLYPRLITTNSANRSFKELLRGLRTDCVEVVFEASGAPGTLQSAIEAVSPGGCIVQIGCPVEEIVFSVSDAQAKEVRLEFIFRYAHVYPRVLELLSSGNDRGKRPHLQVIRVQRQRESVRRRKR